MYVFRLFLFLVISSSFACKDKNNPSPVIPEVRYEGVVYVGCDIGPYGLNLDSLITFCTSPVDLDRPLDSLMSGCIFDEIGSTLSSNHDVELKRGNELNVIELSYVKGDPVITEIPITIAGQEYVWGEYPLYSGYLIKWSTRTLRIHALNKWVGGCFHDLILWEVIDN